MKNNIIRLCIGAIWGALLFSIISAIGTPVSVKIVTGFYVLQEIVVVIFIAILSIITAALSLNDR